MDATTTTMTSAASIPSTKIMSVTTLSGTAVGFVSFLLIGLVPALYFGGFAGLVLAGGIFGAPVPQTLLAQGLVAFGMVLGVMAVGAMFLVGGAFVGSMLGWLGLAAAGRTHDVHAEE